MTIAVLDACVLYRGTVTDILLNLAEQGLFDPIWSKAITEEWTRNLADRTTIPHDRIQHRRQAMDSAFPGALCEAPAEIWKAVIDQCVSPAEAKDAHVVATGIAAEADTIVTTNLSDFPARLLSPFNLVAVPPDQFVLALSARDPEGVLAGIRAHHGSLKRPLLSRYDYLALLSSPKAELHQTRAWLESNGF